MADTTFRIVGSLAETGCKSDRRYFDVSVETPYPHEAQLMVVARHDQDCDAFIDAIATASARTVQIVARLEDGHLVCGTDDLTAITV